MWPNPKEKTKFVWVLCLSSYAVIYEQRFHKEH